MKIHQLLGHSIGPRSHFLPITPMITLGEHFPSKGLPETQVAYVMHHEYLHYEQFTTWPITLLQYVEQSLKLSSLFARYHRVTTSLAGPQGFGLGSIIPFESTGWDDRHVAANQPSSFSIGLGALLEADAILDCFRKTEENLIARVGVQVVELLFRQRNLSSNRTHIIGTESCLAAVGLGNQEFRDPRLREMLALASSLPRLVFLFSLGRALISVGVEEHNWNHDQILSKITSHPVEFFSNYRNYVREGIHVAFAERGLADWLLDRVRLRDVSIVGTHAAVTVLFSYMQKLVPDDAPAFPLLASQWTVLHLLKLFEAVNPRTLTRYGAKVMHPVFTPVPAIFFRRQELGALWLKVLDEESGDVTIKSNPLDLNEDEIIGWLHWTRYACVHEVGEALQQSRKDVTCPFRIWIMRQFTETGVNDETAVNKHLGVMCNGNLRLTATGEVIDTTIYPSAEYCTCSTTDETQDIRCLFRSTVKELLWPSFTIRDLKRQGSNLRNKLKK